MRSDAPPQVYDRATRSGQHPLRDPARIAQPQRVQEPSISCVVPAHDEASNLPILLDKLTHQLQQMSPRWEVVIVDDGSRDQTLAAIAPWLARPGVVCLQLSRNFGKEAALGAGLDHARGDVVFTLDADLQHPVEFLPQMLQAWREGADMVYAVRRDRSGESVIKRIGTRMFYAIMKMGSSIEIPPNAGDYRLLDRCVVEALSSLPERTRFMKGLYAWVGFRARAIDFDPPARASVVLRYSASIGSQEIRRSVPSRDNENLGGNIRAQFRVRIKNKAHCAIPRRWCDGRAFLQRAGTEQFHRRWLRVRKRAEGVDPRPRAGHAHVMGAGPSHG